MRIKETNFPSILKDNEEAYFKLLEAVINSVDEAAWVEAIWRPTGYLLRIAPSHPQYLPPLLKEMKIFHRTLGIEVDFSKSMKTSATVTFLISN